MPTASSICEALRPAVDAALASYHMRTNATVCREAVRRYRAHRAIMAGLGYCQCEHASHRDSSHDQARPAATHTHRTDFGVFHVCAACDAAGHMPADLPSGRSGRRPPTPAETDAILRRYRTGEQALELRRAIDRYRARKAAGQAQALLARDATGTTDAARWLHEQLPGLAWARVVELVVGIVTRYQQTESERPGC